MNTDRFKFRAKRIGDNKFIVGYLCFIYIDDPSKGRIYCQDDCWSYDVHTNTIGQCTGLKDKNGKLIFEGDIVTDGERIGYITWFDESGAWGVTGFLFGRNPDRLEIIGNIYENKELLK